MTQLRIALVQLNMTVGDIQGNCRKIATAISKARESRVDIVVFPEMSITGYPPEDLLLKPDFIEAARNGLTELLPLTSGLTAIIGMPFASPDLHNAAAVIHNKELAAVYPKRFLPNYGVFDENRYFQSGRSSPIFNLGEVRFGVSICEDIWYPTGPPEEQASRGGAHLLVNISASPYYMGKCEIRERMLSTRAVDNAAFVAYCNLVGGQDELIFEGQSSIWGPQGHVLARAPQFEEHILIADLDIGHVINQRLLDPRRRKLADVDSAEGLKQVILQPNPQKKTTREPIEPRMHTPLKPLAEVLEALVLGTRDYVRKNGFEKVVIGLSGGIDSSLTAVVAAQALGNENVVGVSMPSRYSSQHSRDDARLLADNIAVEYLVIPIDAIFQAFLDTLEPQFKGTEPNVAEENIQARIRGALLMALSNKFGWMVLTTGNKSEVGVGYSTLYGDTAGGFAILKDIPKTMIYEICEHINQNAQKAVIPDRVMTKPPSAELRPNQKDSDSLPEYDILDTILLKYVEENRSVEDMVAMGLDRDKVEKVVKLIDRSEYKRRQSPPGIKVMTRAFGKDWRLPITNFYRPYE
jgi:NAD+ synthase (glutamine-hydrolysing)